jgi:hypothetical protein
MPSHPTLSSKSTDWQTPPGVVRLVEAVAGGRITLDPCSAEGNPTDAVYYWFPPERDGLKGSWSCASKGLAYVNPPFRDIAQWAMKLVGEYHAGAVDQAILMCGPSTDSQWFVDYVWKADAVAFWHGDKRMGAKGSLAPSRIQFIDPTTGNPARGNTRPSVIAYWGRWRRAFAAAFERYAHVVMP